MAPAIVDSRGDLPVIQAESNDENLLDIKKYDDISLESILIMVTAMLTEIVEINDRLPFNPQKLTRFHSRTPAGITIKDYLHRIVRFCSIDKAILVVIVYFIDLLSQSFPNFVLNSLTVHRFLITGVTIASKGLCDSFCTNAHYAKVGGLSQMELNFLEVEFLTRVNYKIVPNYDILKQFYANLSERHGHLIQTQPKSSNTTKSISTAAPQQSKTAPAQSEAQRTQQSSGASRDSSKEPEPPVSQPPMSFRNAMSRLLKPSRKRLEDSQNLDRKRQKSL